MALRSYIDPSENREAKRERPRLMAKPARRPMIESRLWTIDAAVASDFARRISCLYRRSGL